MRRTTTPLAPGGALRRPLSSTSTPKRLPRMPTARSFMLFPPRATSRASRRLSAGGTRTMTLFFECYQPSADSTIAYLR